MKVTNGFSNLGQWLKAELWKRKLSACDLAELTGLGRSTIYSWLADRYRPDRKQVEKLAQILSHEPVFDHFGRTSKETVFAYVIESLFTRHKEGRPPKRPVNRPQEHDDDLY